MFKHSSRLVSSLCIVACFVILLLPAALVWASDKANPQRTAPQSEQKSTKSKKDTVTGWVLIADLAGSFNNPGVRLIGRGGYQWRLYDHPHLAFANNFIRLNAIVQATPANIGGGPNLAIQPASFIRVGINYSARLFFPAFTVGTTFKDQSDIAKRFDGTTNFLDGEARLGAQRDLIIQRNKGYLGVHMHVINLHWLVQLRVLGFVAQFLGAFSWYYPQFTDVDNSEFIYEAGGDLIIKKTDQVFNALIVAGYEWRNLRFLLVNSYTVALQSKEEIWGIGPGLQWTITPQWKALKDPFFLFVARWWVRHRFRTGAMPNIGVIFQTSFDV